jgi:AcrR family transcriptional regulator
VVGVERVSLRVVERGGPVVHDLGCVELRAIAHVGDERGRPDPRLLQRGDVPRVAGAAPRDERDRLLAAASEVFAERGLDAPLEEIARRAAVSIGTLYNHFPTLADADPWTGFVTFTEALFALHAEDRGLNDALAQRVPLSPGLIEACHRCFGHLDRLIARARDSGQLRADFEIADFATLVWAMSQVIRESTDVAPQAWRRCLTFFLDGLRAGAAHPLPVPAITADELSKILAT